MADVDDDKPSFTATDLALLNSDGPDVAQEADAELDATVAKLVRGGIYTREEAQKHYHYTDEEMERALAPPVSRGSVERQLADLRQLRKTDGKKYWGDEVQSRERKLIELRERMRSKEPAREAEPAGEADTSGMDPALLKEWEGTGGIEHHLGLARRTARAALDGLESDDRADLEARFDRLPAAAQTAIIRHLAVDGGAWRPADDARLRKFVSTEEGAALAKEWGSQAGRKLGIVCGQLKSMLKDMEPGDRAAVEKALDELPPNQLVAVLRALAG